jgi:hypothetical protein
MRTTDEQVLEDAVLHVICDREERKMQASKEWREQAREYAQEQRAQFKEVSLAVACVVLVVLSWWPVLNASFHTHIHTHIYTAIYRSCKHSLNN